MCVANEKADGMQFTDLRDAGLEHNGQAGLAFATASPKQKRKAQKKLQKKLHMYQPTVGEELTIVKQDHLVKTHPSNNHNRRTLVLTKDCGSWGFTIQSYGIQHRTDLDIEDLTYVDYVDIDGPAFRAGMKKGDIILSVNGISTDEMNHGSLVNVIQSCHTSMRLVVLFEDCGRKVELHLRYIKLKKVLAAKEFELNSIDKKIERLRRGEKIANPRRLSVAASTSCSTLWDDRWSLLPAPPAAPIQITVEPPHGENEPPNDTTSLRNSAPQRCTMLTVPTHIDHQHCLGNHQLSVSSIDLREAPCEVIPESYNSLPIRSKKKRPMSLLLPSRPKIPGFSSRPNSCKSSPSEPEQASTDRQSPSPEDAGLQNGFVRALSRRLRSRSSSRSRSFRASFRQSMSPAMGEPHVDSSNYVVTEQNSRSEAEPTLLRLRKGDLDLKHADWSGVERQRPVSLTRSFSSPQFQKLTEKMEKQCYKTEHQDAISQIAEKCVRVSTNESLRRSQSDSGYASQQKQPIRAQHFNDIPADRLRGRPPAKITYTQDDCVVRSSKQTIPNSARNDTRTLSANQHPSSCANTDSKQVTSIRVSRNSSNESGVASLCHSTSRGSTGSTASSVSNTSSGFFEFYEDPFTPSPEDCAEFPYTKRSTETPIVSSFKKMSRRILTYSRHKDIIKQELRLMNINEEEEITKL